MLSPRISSEEEAKREIPSFIEARPPLVLNPFMRPRPTKGKKLFTDVMDMEDSDFEEPEEPELVQIYVRLKPCKAPSIEVYSERSLITSLNTTTAGHGRRTQHNVSKMYTFSHIFGPDSNQREIFERVVKDNLKKLPDGNSFTLLTYGASGSGKTFTLMGTVTNPGLVPRSLEYVFKLIEAQQHPLYKPDEKGAYRLTNAEQEYELKVVRQLRKLSGNLPEYRDRYRRMSAGLGGDLTNSNIDLASRRSHYVWVSFIEIYNEAVYDLLGGDKRNAAKLAIREDASGNVYVKGAIQAFVRSCDEAYDVLVAGKLHLQVAATGIHAHSSRSHCIFTITMLTDTENGMRSACVRLCDLAGCERAARTRNTGARMQESRAINASLHVLERCLHSLRRKRTVAALVPYRESKLTRILGSGLSGTRGEAVSMVVTLNPSAEYANENKHVLQLAAVAKDIPISDTLAEYPSSMESSSRDATIIGHSFEVMQLRAENERLLFELKQAQARNKELRACMDEKQAEHDKMLGEVVDETIAVYKDHYEKEIKRLEAKIETMEEEYECRLRELSLDNPSQRYRDRIAELKNTIAVLEKKLLDREKDAEELESRELECIEKNYPEKEELSRSNDEDEDVISLNESDDDCLIPTLNKKEIKHLQKIRQSMIEDLRILKRASGIKESSSEESDPEEPVVGDHDHDANLTSESLDTSDTSDTDNAGFSTVKKVASRFTEVIDGVNDDAATMTMTQGKEILELKPHRSRETYCVPVSEVLNISKDKLQSEIPKSLKYDIVKDIDISKPNEISDSLEDMVDIAKNTAEPKNLIHVTSKIIGLVKQSVEESDNSLLQFERLEMESREIIDSDKKIVSEEFYNIKPTNENRKFFGDDCLDKNPKTPATVVKAKDKMVCDNSNVEKSNLDKNSETTTVPPVEKTYFFGESIIRLADKTDSVKKNKTSRDQDSIYIFDSPQVNKVQIVETQTKATPEQHATLDKVGPNIDSVNIIQSKSNAIKNTNQAVTSKKEAKATNVINSDLTIISAHNIIEKGTTKMEFVTANENKLDNHPLEILHSDESQSQANCTKTNDTTTEFEKIYKDISASRATEFDLLISQESIEENQNKTEYVDLKYNLRHKPDTEKSKTERKRGKKNVGPEEILLESVSKCESSSKPNRRNLRLRRQKTTDEEVNLEDIGRKGQLEDIGNLQIEFSDVTMGLPAPLKTSKDIPSPEKLEEKENSAPKQGIRSCPAKSITRSRRKLFTPRAEPLDESLEVASDSDDKVRVRRPSYHRPRARRKL